MPGPQTAGQLIQDLNRRATGQNKGGPFASPPAAPADDTPKTPVQEKVNLYWQELGQHQRRLESIERNERLSEVDRTEQRQAEKAQWAGWQRNFAMMMFGQHDPTMGRRVGGVLRTMRDAYKGRVNDLSDDALHNFRLNQDGITAARIRFNLAAETVDSIGAKLDNASEYLLFVILENRAAIQAKFPLAGGLHKRLNDLAQDFGATEALQQARADERQFWMVDVSQARGVIKDIADNEMFNQEHDSLIATFREFENPFAAKAPAGIFD